jgi:hypothetical protein
VEQQLGTALHPMFATVEIAKAVESFDGQGQHGEEPADQQTVGVMMTDMLEAVTTLGDKPFIEERGEAWRKPTIGGPRKLESCPSAAASRILSENCGSSPFP